MKARTVIPMLCLLAVVSCGSKIFAGEVEDGSTSESGNARFDEPDIGEYEREHWSFLPLVRPEVPEVQNPSWTNNEIDNFILYRLERKDLQPSTMASREVFLRRVKFDLLGLPPTPNEVQDFLDDTSELAYENLVDRLLASPGYGERWGQYWLDLARFAETDGFEHDKVRPNAWQYRQWVIDAFNRDLPYDHFVTMQLAGDLLPEPQEIATGFCLAGPDMPDINEQDLRRHDKLNEITATVGAAFLGLQMGCAQCHDHKYDPISQADFYRLRAVFENGIPPLKRDRPIEYLRRNSQPLPAHFYFRGELTRTGSLVEAAPPRIACSSDDQREEYSDQPRLAFTQWMFDAENPLVARVIANRIWQYHFGKSLCGNPSDVGVVASEPTHPELLDWLAVELQSTGWSLKQLHRKIVLSATYRQSGFSEAVETSRRNQLDRSIELDPENRLYFRFPRKRLEGEAIRDALLSVAGTLNRTYGGPSVMPPLPEEMKQTLLRGQWQDGSDVADHHRRSIYVFARRNLRYPIFDVFDRPDAGASCPQRNTSTTALQSLELLNGRLAVDCARALSHRVIREMCGRDSLNEQSFSADLLNPEACVDHLFMLAYSRRSRFEEARIAVELLKTRSAKELNERNFEERLFVLCLAMLNTNEFIYID